MTLRLGQDVDYFPKTNDPLNQDDGRMVAGKVARINNSDHANLCVLNPSGDGWEGRHNVRVIEDPNIALERGCCRPVDTHRRVELLTQRVAHVEQHLESAGERLDKLIDQLETQLRNDKNNNNGQPSNNVSTDAKSEDLEADVAATKPEAEQAGGAL